VRTRVRLPPPPLKQAGSATNPGRGTCLRMRAHGFCGGGGRRTRRDSRSEDRKRGSSRAATLLWPQSSRPSARRSRIGAKRRPQITPAASTRTGLTSIQGVRPVCFPRPFQVPDAARNASRVRHRERSERRRAPVVRRRCLPRVSPIGSRQGRSRFRERSAIARGEQGWL